MLTIRIHILSVLLYITNTLGAQNIPDSMVYKLNHAPDDSVRARTLLDIGESIEATQTEKSFNYYQRSLAIARKLNNSILLLSSLNDVGVCYIELNKMDSALLTFGSAIPIAKKIRDTLRIAKIFANMGNAWLHKQDRVKAIDYYLQSVRLLESISDESVLPTLYSNINSLFNEQKEFTKALDFGNRAVVFARKTNNDYALVNSLLNLAVTYDWLDQPEKQMALLRQALPIAKKNADLDQIVTTYHNLGSYYFMKGDYHSSLEQYLESYKYVQKINNKYHICSTSSMLALVYLKLKETKKAVEYSKQAEKLAYEVGERANLKEIYKTRAEIEQQSGHFELANKYFEKTIEVSDSLYQAETSEKVADVEARYQTEKKQLAITQLEKDKKIQLLAIKEKSILNYLLVAAVGALLVTGLLVYRNIRNRQLLAKKETELQEQRIGELEKDRQLVAVDSMLKGQEEERSRLAKDLHDGLGGLLSGVKFSLSNMKNNFIITGDNLAVFERSLDMIDTSIKELRRVAHNMMPEMLTRFGLDEALKEYCNMVNSTKMVMVKYQSFGMEARLEKSAEIIVYRIIQELINNIMKHAGATEAFVQLIRGDNRLNIVVEDNGKGFDPAVVKKNAGAGWININSRVEYLKGKLDIHSESGKGTMVNIELNV
ncbi:MAG: tetratricopeptide repeat protein [Chitinophagaceae bacterium]|nr:tetratricopeptide repeat protein [Chitinophagaceae bacterium]